MQIAQDSNFQRVGLWGKYVSLVCIDLKQIARYFSKQNGFIREQQITAIQNTPSNGQPEASPKNKGELFLEERGFGGAAGNRKSTGGNWKFKTSGFSLAERSPLPGEKKILLFLLEEKSRKKHLPLRDTKLHLFLFGVIDGQQAVGPESSPYRASQH